MNSHADTPREVATSANDLPAILWKKVFDRLKGNVKDLRACRTVNKSWKEILDNEFLNYNPPPTPPPMPVTLRTPRGMIKIIIGPNINDRYRMPRSDPQ